jgi:hypothetical protein
VITLETYETEQGRMVASADTALVGEVYKEDGVRVDVDPEFYGETAADRGDVMKALRGASIANLVGEDAVEAGVDADIVDETNVLRVDGVPHAQMVRL